MKQSKVTIQGTLTAILDRFLFLAGVINNDGFWNESIERD
jgi:hypothetical protein